MTKLKLSGTYKTVSITKPVKVTWQQLTQDQKDEFTRQLKHAGWKDESQYPTFTYQLRDGICYGWNDPTFFL